MTKPYQAKTAPVVLPPPPSAEFALDLPIVPPKVETAEPTPVRAADADLGPRDSDETEFEVLPPKAHTMCGNCGAVDGQPIVVRMPDGNTMTFPACLKCARKP